MNATLTGFPTRSAAADDSRGGPARVSGVSAVGPWAGAGSAAGCKGDGDESGPQVDVAIVFRDHAGRVFGVARRILGNDADAEDVTQEVLVQVLRKAGSFRGESSLSTWLYRVTVNAALALRRKRVTWRERPMSDPLERVFSDRPRPGVAGPPGCPGQAALGNEM